VTHDVRLRAGSPESEYSARFLQGMLDRMAVSYFKYGAVVDAYPDKVDALGCARERLARYAQTGNAEELVEASNYLMIEFMAPAHPEAHYDPQDSATSPGRRTHRGDATARRNEDLRGD